MKPLKVLVLSCNTGGGHNSAADAICTEFADMGISADRVDGLSFATKNTSRNICRTYINMTIKAPAAFGLVYNAGRAISTAMKKSPVYFLNSLYAKKLLEYINENGYTDVICTHLFPAEAMTYLRRNDLCSVRTYAVATDYTCIPFWQEIEPDCHFIPHHDLLSVYEERGVKAENMLATGIPVSKKFYAPPDRDQARRQLSIPADAEMILVMSGSMGFGNVSDMVGEILKDKRENTIVCVLAGNNEKLKNILKKNFADRKDVRVIPFTTEVNKYMASADVILTKPGGLTSTEAAAMRVPLVHTEPIPGCETCNSVFFSERGISVTAANAKQAAEKAIMLCREQTARLDMKKAQQQHIDPFAVSKICSYVKKESEERVNA